MIYVPQKKAENMDNSYSGRKKRIFQEKKFFFEDIEFSQKGPPLDIFGIVQYFPKKFENLKNNFAGTCLVLRGTKSRVLVILVLTMGKW